MRLIRFWLIMVGFGFGLLPPFALATQCGVTVTPMGFGTYDPLSPTPLTSTASIDITCRTPSRLTQTVTVQVSAGSSGNVSQRTLSAATGSSLLYNLYTGPGLSQIFGDGTGASADLTRQVHRDNPWNLTIYGHVPELQNVPPGLYQDNLTVTILW